MSLQSPIGSSSPSQPSDASVRAAIAAARAANAPLPAYCRVVDERARSPHYICTLLDLAEVHITSAGDLRVTRCTTAPTALMAAIDASLIARGWPRASREPGTSRGRQSAEQAYSRRVAGAVLDRECAALPIATRARAMGCTAQTYRHYQQAVSGAQLTLAAEIVDEICTPAAS